MGLNGIIERFLDKKNLDDVNTYGISTMLKKSYDFLRSEITIQEEGAPYDVIALEMVTPLLNVKSLTSILMEAKNNLSDDGILVFDFIEETKPMLTIAKKMESWRGKEEEEVFCYTLIDIASSVTALGMNIASLENVGSIGGKKIVAIFVNKSKAL